MATLASTLIVIATLNTTVVPLITGTETRVLLSLFLILIPTTLHFYIAQKEKAVLAALKIVASYQGDHILDVFKKATFMDYLNSTIPRIIVYIFYGSIFLILFRIWFG